MGTRLALSAIFACLFLAVLPAAAQFDERALGERIHNYDVDIDVQKDGDIVVTEIIHLTAEGRKIRRGIFRDVPRFFEKNGDRYRYDYDIKSIKRNGKREQFETEIDDNALRVRIGNADRLLNRGEHTYEIIYEVKNEIRYHDTYDELYWNVTGSYWDFPIDAASATITLPNARTDFIQESAYTGRQGSTEQAYKFSRNGEGFRFVTTRPLKRFEGLSVALGFEKGIVAPPSGSDLRGLWLQKWGSLVALILTSAAMLYHYMRGFLRVGQDPPSPPVFARYEPPAGFSPAAVHRVLNRGFSGNEALTATLLKLASLDYIHIEVEDKDETSLLRRDKPVMNDELDAEEVKLLSNLFSSKDKMTIGSEYSSSFAAAYQIFRSKLNSQYGRSMFRWNPGYALIAVPISLLVIFFVIGDTLNWTIWHTAGILALAAMNALFLYLMPAPTEAGAAATSEIKGFKLYLEKAEKLQMNDYEVGSGTPPPMSVERYEKFLPYAVALGVEKPWTKHFEKQMPVEAKAYDPHWTNVGRGRHGTIRGINNSVLKSVSAAAATASRPPSSSGSSGSGGGGFSGGGGGGGGGGGW